MYTVYTLLRNKTNIQNNTNTSSMTCVCALATADPPSLHHKNMAFTNADVENLINVYHVEPCL